jgi:Transposase
LPPSKIGLKLGEKKAQGQMDGAFLDWALKAFSGYVAADELYEGPYCVLSAVDNRQYKRILYQVLDHDPNHDDVQAFLGRLKTALDVRDLALKGITTDGSALYPEAIRAVFGEVPHQLCTFHIIAELTKGVLRAVAKERERLAQSKPKLKRGRVASKDKEARRSTRKSKSIQQKVSDLFQARFLFVKRRLTLSERHRLLQITRGLPQLRKLREIMDHIYALFDRRCRTQTGLGKLRKLRHWVKRFRWIGDTLKKVFSPHLEKALTFLDDKLLPATSNAVERGNRRYRKMQKSVYRVRSKVCLEGRIALDMLRESRAEGRDQTTRALHQARRGCT